MADRYPVTQPRSQALDAPVRTQPAPRFPDDPEAARAEIEKTRARMSETIDEIEDVLQRKKAEVQEKLDVTAPVREDPVKVLSIIFGAALVLGWLTGGGGGKKGNKETRELHLRLAELEASGALAASELEADSDHEEEIEHAWSEAEMWEDRAHRLLRIAKAQETELELHRSRREALRRRLQELRHREAEIDRHHHHDHDDDDLEPGILDRVRGAAAGRFSELSHQLSQRMMRGN